jgi:putative DNA primase/helicase
MKSFVVLDAGDRRDGAVIRLVGDSHEPRQFSVWALVALAAIGRLPGTIEDRSIIVTLRRRRPDEEIASLRRGRALELEALARKAVRWAADHPEDIASADPEMPAGIHNRAADNWHPLLVIADLAGGEWPERARQTAIELSREGGDSESAPAAIVITRFFSRSRAPLDRVITGPHGCMFSRVPRYGGIQHRTAVCCLAINAP